MEFSPPSRHTGSRKRVISGSISPHERPDLQPPRNPATSPPRMAKKRKLLTAPKESGRDDHVAGMEVQERFGPDADGIETGAETRIPDSGRLQSLNTSPPPMPALGITDAPHAFPQLSPEEARTQMYNIRGRTQASSPLGPASHAIEAFLHEVPDPFPATEAVVHQPRPTHQTMAEGPSSADTMIASDEGFHDSTVSATIMSPLAYRTPIRTREFETSSGGHITQELPRRIRRNGSAVVLPDRHAHSTFQDSLSPTRRLGHGSRSTAGTLSRSPSVPSTSAFMLSRSPSASSPSAFMLPPLADGSPTSFRTSVIELRGFNSLTRRSRHNEDAENRPMELDFDRTVVSSDVRVSFTRSRTMQLQNDVGRWQRSPSGQGSANNPDDGYRNAIPPNHTVSERLASRQNIASEYSAQGTDLDFASFARAGSQPIRAGLPRIQGASNRTVQNRTGEARDSMEPLGTIDYNHFTSSHGGDLGRTTRFGSSVMTAPGRDERDGDVVMESSSPVAYSNAGSDLVEDMGGCQLEGDLPDRVTREDTWGASPQQEEHTESSQRALVR